MKFLAVFALLLAALAFFARCKTGSGAVQSTVQKPAESYDPFADKPLVSTINIPVNISQTELETAVNAQLTDLIYEDGNLEDDGLMLRAWKIQPVTLSLSGNEIRYRVPLNIWVKKKLGFTAADVDGDIALSFKTIFNIKEDWSLETWTQIERHDWLKKPKLKTSVWDVPVETIANIVLSKAKGPLSASIDELVRSQISLRPAVAAAWEALQTPSLLSEEYRMWVKTTPLSMTVAPFRSSNGAIQTNIGVEAISEVTMGEKPAFRSNSALPPFRFSNVIKDDFAMQITTDVPFSEAEALAKKMMVGQVFSGGGKTVKVEDIELFGQQEKMVIGAQLSGAVRGKIYFIGKPFFDSTTNAIKMQNLDYHLETKNFLIKSAGWLFKGPIKNQMQKAMTFPLEENVNELKKSITQTLERYEIKPGVVLSGQLEDVRFERCYLTQQSIRVDLSSRGRLSVDMKGF